MQIEILATIAVSAIGIIFSIRGEGRSNRTEAAADRREMHAILREMKTETHAEMKDFHNRLLILEERYLKTKEK